MTKGRKEASWMTSWMKTKMKGKNKVPILNNMSIVKTFRREGI